MWPRGTNETTSGTNGTTLRHGVAGTNVTVRVNLMPRDPHPVEVPSARGFGNYPDADSYQIRHARARPYVRILKYARILLKNRPSPHEGRPRGSWRSLHVVISIGRVVAGMGRGAPPIVKGVFS